MDAQPTVPNSAPPAATVPSRKFPSVPVFSFLILILLSSTAFLAYQNMQLTKQIVSLQKTPTPTPKSTLGWYTYKDITFHYPDTWSMKTDAYGSLVLHQSANELPHIYVSTIDNPKNLTVAEYQREASKEGPTPNFYSSQAQQMSIEGIPGYLIENNGCEPALCDTFAFSFNKKIYTITVAYSLQATQADPIVRASHKSLLSSLTFVNSPYYQDLTCGGFAGTLCPTGFMCKLNGNYPDAGGTCAREIPTTTPRTDYIISPTPTNKFTCPSSGWVDCMPKVGPDTTNDCSPEAMTWYKANCPNFQGGAY